MKIDVNDYTYDLPQERIAQYPLAQRDQSKLLVYDRGIIHDEQFTNLAEHLPAGSSLFFNQTKVIPARLLFQKETGAVIEIFLLAPVTPSPLLLEAIQSSKTCSWKCVIGNLKRWTNNTSLSIKIGEIDLAATLQERHEKVVQFTWKGEFTFGDILQRIGNTPLPPYLKRSAEEIDKERYQTIYSAHEGAVAAPTAGLHFTPAVFDSLKKKNISTDFVTLHVSAGTFLPIKVKNALEHPMHEEQVVISRENIKNLLKATNVVAVGTTSLRTLESLYWYGVKLMQDPTSTFRISQQYPYTQNELPAAASALSAVLKHMDETNKNSITGETSIYIVPGYPFRVCQSLITNFHQPGSTLILLVAAFIGDDWKKIYGEALSKDYRFLSYGDSSLLIPKNLNIQA
ncbi:MAG TPA: S-adenosylmethionine:tRNA ribosyltransferase-isomerase, partial [Chryseolinea sp.]|nr:S-adenosylmethionine:tRNA ribosyltransferase-isomerase [Chryseolinea sp.]